MTKMPDREKYIEVLSKTAKKVKEFNEDTPIKISLECIEDILELLKEQAVVRCKDCKNADYGTDEDGNRFMKCIGSVKCYGGTTPDFFCADGKRKG